MLQIDDRLASYRIGAGEAWIMSVQMKAMVGSAIIDWSTRRLVLSFYGPGRTLVEQIEGVYSSDATGAYFAFIRDGRFSESLLGKSVQVELAERLLEGRAVIATGPLTVAATSDGVSSFGSIIGRIDARFTFYFSATGLLSLIEQELLPYAGVPITPGPVIATPAGINSDGTPQVGETFTLVRPTGNGPVVGERLLENGVDVFGEVDDLHFTARVAGSLRYEADLQGPDGTIATSGSDIVVLAATPPATVTVDPTVQRSGRQYTFMARRTGDLSQPATRTMQVAASTDYPPGSPASDWPNGTYATAIANFAAGSATAPFTISAPDAAQPE